MWRTKALTVSLLFSFCGLFWFFLTLFLKKLLPCFHILGKQNQCVRARVRVRACSEVAGSTTKQEQMKECSNYLIRKSFSETDFLPELRSSPLLSPIKAASLMQRPFGAFDLLSSRQTLSKWLLKGLEKKVLFPEQGRASVPTQAFTSMETL